MANKLAQFYQKLSSGDDRFTLSTGRYFSIVFSFPDNTYGEGIFGKLTGGIKAATAVADRFGFGTAGGALQTGISLLSKEIGLADNNMFRFPQDEIHWLVKGINLPNMKIGEGNAVSLNSSANSFSTVSIPGMGAVEPESDTFSLDLLPTVESPIEGFFIPWMEEVMNSGNDANVPFRRANVFIHVYNENSFGRFSEKDKFGLLDDVNVKYTYKLSGVYPNFCDTPNLSHEAAMDNRSVGFSFNNISVYGNPIAGAFKSFIPSSIQSPVRQLADKVRRFVPSSDFNF